MDVLEQEAAGADFETATTDVGFVIKARLPGLRWEDLEITFEGNTLHILDKKADSHAPREGVFHLPSGCCITAAHAAFSNGELRIIVPKSGT